MAPTRGVEDASHRPQRLHGLHRHDVSNLETLMPWEAGAKMPVKPVKAYDPGCVHMDVKYLPQMPDEDPRQYRFAAIDRATRFGSTSKALGHSPPLQAMKTGPKNNPAVQKMCL